MRLISWNCAQKAHLKLDKVLARNPDILVLPECAEPDILRSKMRDFRPTSDEWTGHDRHKGLGVFAFGDCSLSLHDSFNPALRHYLPCIVRGPKGSFHLLAVWAFRLGDPPKVVPNPTSLPAALAHYELFLSSPGAIVAGDFNAGAKWDTQRSPLFRVLAERFETFGLRSAFHAGSGLPFGDSKEPPTFFDRTRKDQPQHIDYVFAAHGVGSISIGRREDWRPHSDHMPLVYDFELVAQPA